MASLVEGVLVLCLYDITNGLRFEMNCVRFVDAITSEIKSYELVKSVLVKVWI